MVLEALVFVIGRCVVAAEIPWNHQMYGTTMDHFLKKEKKSRSSELVMARILDLF